jgi:hypothetical protein
LKLQATDSGVECQVSRPVPNIIQSVSPFEAEARLNKTGKVFPYRNTKAKKAKGVPLHAMKALGGRVGIASTHSRPRH